MSYQQKKEVQQKEKKKQKKKNVLKYGKLSEFPTFQHDKQATSYLILIFKKKNCIVHLRTNGIPCIVFTGFTHKSV
jgi:hypothetical protein